MEVSILIPRFSRLWFLMSLATGKVAELQLVRDKRVGANSVQPLVTYGNGKSRRHVANSCFPSSRTIKCLHLGFQRDKSVNISAKLNESNKFILLSQCELRAQAHAYLRRRDKVNSLEIHRSTFGRVPRWIMFYFVGFFFNSGL
jgi:hypothetical protein